MESKAKECGIDRFANYAGKKNIDEAISEELRSAGIEVSRFSVDMKREVQTRVFGYLHGWYFQRAWSYWVAEGPGIEVGTAEILHQSFGREVRVAGHCGCPSPREWFKGLACGSYHVDTPRGLKALADTIRGLCEKDSSLDRAP